MATASSRNDEGTFIDWEQLDSTKGLTVLRVPVPGGWLVYASNSYHQHGGITFIRIRVIRGTAEVCRGIKGNTAFSPG